MFRPIFFFVCLILLCTTLMAGASKGKYVVTASGQHTAQDSVPNIKKVGLIKKLLDALKFRKNARAKEQERVLVIIDKSGLKKALDSLSKQVTGLGKEDTGSDKAIADLQKSIKDLQASFSKTTKTTGPGIDSTIENAGDNLDVPLNDKDIEDLVQQIVPMLNTNDKQAEKQKKEKAKAISSLLSKPGGVTDTLSLNDSVKRIFAVSIGHAATVTGVYNYNSGVKYKSIDLRLINSLAYYGATFDGSTGNVDPHGWDSAKVIDLAEKQGCRISLMLVDTSLVNRVALFKGKAQEKLIDNIITLLSRRHTSGIVVYFANLRATESNQFIDFINKLSSKLKSSGRGYALSIVIPRNDTSNIYDLEVLNEYADNFFIDFTRVIPDIPGPLAPLQSSASYDLKSCVSRFRSFNIPLDKLIAYLPYYGMIWQPDPRKRFTVPFKTISYNDIRKGYPVLPEYDKATSTAYINIHAKDTAQKGSDNSNEPVIGQIWYDDDKTMSLKYDYVLTTGLGGIAIQSIGYDGNYGELRDALVDKFLVIDTISSKDIKLVKGPPPEDTWKWDLAFLNAKYEQYYFLFAYPCEQSFPGVLIKKWASAGVVNFDRKSIRLEATELMKITTFILLILCLAFLVLFIYQIRRLAKWKWKKFFAALLILLTVLLTVSTSMYMFVDTKIVGFGASDSAQDCYDFPISTIFSFIFCGILVGGAITKFLVFPLIKREDIP